MYDSESPKVSEVCVSVHGLDVCPEAGCGLEIFPDPGGGCGPGKCQGAGCTPDVFSITFCSKNKTL